MFKSYGHIKFYEKELLKNASGAKLIRISLKFNELNYEALNLKTFKEIQRLW